MSDVSVSIHAPARGATCWLRCIRLPQNKFQSTRPRGARLASTSTTGASTCCFNPRAREGRDLKQYHLAHFQECFNPRAREGRDIIRLVNVFALCVFQSTRPRGARHTPCHAIFMICQVSIHAPARGATIVIPGLLNLEAAFQSTRPRGARHVTAAPLTLSEVTVSIHAPARGAT